MGLREKVALVTVAVITAQIVCSLCMPRGLPNCSVKSHISSLISPKSDSIREFKINRKLKKNSYNNAITGNSSKVLHLPNVEEPTDVEAGGYYRFYCDYPHEPQKLPKTQFQTRNFKREIKQKRYHDLSPRDKGQLPTPTTNSRQAEEPRPQPYCFRKSSLFPEVEYPLSARDMWIPKYWSRLLDAEVPRKGKIDGSIYQNQEKNAKSIYSSYENSPLYDIIQSLNNNNKSDSEKMDSCKLKELVPKKSENESKFDGTFPYLLPEYTPPSKDTTPFIDSGVVPYTKTTTEAYPALETATVSSIAPPPVTSATTLKATEKENFSDFDFIDVTTALPLEDFTSPITQSITSANKFISLPTTVAPSTELTTTSELLSFISSTGQIPEQELRDHTTPIQLTTLPPMQSSDMTHTHFDKIDISTASPSDLFTSPLMHSKALNENSIPRTQTEKELTTLSTVTSTNEEKELSLTGTKKSTTASPLLTFSSTPKPVTTFSTMKSSDMMQSDFDKIAASTASPSDNFTSPMIHSEALTDSTTPHINRTTLSTVIPTRAEENLRLIETNTKQITNLPLLSFSSTVENTQEEELRDYTIPVQLTTLASMKSSDMAHIDFDRIDVSTASPELFTSPMIHSKALSDNTTPHKQMEKIATTLSSITFTRDEEDDLRITETNTKPINILPLLSFSSTTKIKPEEELKDHTTPMQFTILSSATSSDSTASPSDLFTIPMTHSEVLTKTNTKPKTTAPLLSFGSTIENVPEEDLKNYTAPIQSTPSSKSLSGEKVPLTDTIPLFSNNSLDLLPSSNSTFENTHAINDTSISSDQHTFQDQVVEFYYENSNNDDILQLLNSHSGNSSIIITDDSNEDWVYSSNDSYITWESISECSDECFIFIDTENLPSAALVCNDDNLNMLSKPKQPLMAESKCSGEVTNNVTSNFDIFADKEKIMSEKNPEIALDNISEVNLTDLTENTEIETDHNHNPQITGIIKYPADNGLRVLDNIETIADSVSLVDNANSITLKLPLYPDYVNNSISNIVNDIVNTTANEHRDELLSLVNYLTQDIYVDENISSTDNDTTNDLILYIEDMNSTSEDTFVDVDETWASYTEVPYDSIVLYHEDVNDTWTINGNEYVLSEQMDPEDSDDILPSSSLIRKKLLEFSTTKL